MVLKRVPSSIQRLLPKTETKKNTPPLTGGARDGGFFNAPETFQPEFEYIDPSTLPEFSRPTSSPSGFYVDEFTQWLDREYGRELARRHEQELKRIRGDKSIQRLKQQWDEGTKADEQRKRRGYRIPAGFAPYLPTGPTLDVPVEPVTGQPDTGFDTPRTTLTEPDFDIPDDPPEDDEEKREEEFEDCEELAEKIRTLTGISVPFCTGGSGAANIVISSQPARQTIHLVRGERKSRSGRGGE